MGAFKQRPGKVVSVQEEKSLYIALAKGALSRFTITYQTL